MAVVNLKSTLITNATAQPVVPSSANIQNGNIRESQGVFTVTNGDSIGSTYRFHRIRSNDRVASVRIWCGAITSAAADFGLYDKSDVNSGAVVDADFFASAQSIASAVSGLDITFEAGAAGGLITNAEKRVWEALGLSADPGKEYDVTMTLTAAATATAAICLRTQFVTGE